MSRCYSGYPFTVAMLPPPPQAVHSCRRKGGQSLSIALSSGQGTEKWKGEEADEGSF